MENSLKPLGNIVQAWQEKTLDTRLTHQHGLTPNAGQTNTSQPTAYLVPATESEREKRLLNALESWTISEPLEIQTTISEVRAAQSSIARQQTPATKDEIGQAISAIFVFAEAFGMKNPNPEAAIMAYEMILDGIPAWVIKKAVERTIKEHKWGNSLPLPQSVLDRCQPELHRLRVLNSRLSLAASKLVAVNLAVTK
jgi:hypothetical protein